MTDIIINEITLFDTGFVLKSSQELTIGTTYYLDIYDAINNITKTYIPYKNSYFIIDLYDVIVSGNTCFNLYDSLTGCQPLLCSLEVT